MPMGLAGTDDAHLGYLETDLTHTPSPWQQSTGRSYIATIPFLRHEPQVAIHSGKMAHEI
jgi:hypothetical protein